MKISIVSNCQGESLKNCILAMNTGLAVDFYISSDIFSGKINIQSVIDSSNFVFAQKGIEHLLSADNKEKVFYFPVIAFDAFHPDMTYVVGEKLGVKEAIHTPMLTYNSALILYAFLSGLSEAQAIKLFTESVFEKIGYRNRFNDSKVALYTEAHSVGFPIEKYFDSWVRTGCFMYSFNHPTILVMSSIAEHLLQAAAIEVLYKNPSRVAVDALKVQPIWPIYPGIAESYEINGDFAFKLNEPYGILTLEKYIEYCYKIYSGFDPLTLKPINVNIENFDRCINSVSKSIRNPYSGLPDYQFWKKSVATPSMSDVDPVTSLRFQLDPVEKVATAGSCFAQHIARTLSSNGFNYFVAESASESLTTEEAAKGNYSVFSARYGNIYSARQLLQLVQRSSGQFFPHDNFWTREDGKLVDPFRPQIEADGFDTLDSLLEARRIHFDSVNRMFSEMDVFVFTLGLTEAWRSKKDGAVFPLAPGVAGGIINFDEYEFINFNVAQVTDDLQKFIDLLSLVNSKCKIILTVSPVPLIATYEPRHALVSTTYSKAVLRAAAENIRTANMNVDYFPSYEIITGAYSRSSYFESDLRSVTQSGVDHVMRLFMKHFSQSRSRAPQSGSNVESQKAIFDIVCDEESIVKFGG